MEQEEEIKSKATRANREGNNGLVKCRRSSILTRAGQWENPFIFALKTTLTYVILIAQIVVWKKKNKHTILNPQLVVRTSLFSSTSLLH